MSYPTPDNEAGRNAELRAYRVLDSPRERSFDEIGLLAARICDCPVSYISFIEEDRFWTKSRYGLPDDFEGCPREIAFCSVTICGADLIVSNDLRLDERFRDFHFVRNEPFYRFYAAMPLVTPEGHSIGTICVMDFRPRDLSFEQQESLRRLAQQVIGLLEHRRRLIEQDEAMAELNRLNAALAEEKAGAEALLHRVLPEAIARELKESGRVEPRFFPEATVLLADVKGFTSFTQSAEPAMVIGLLDRYFAAFDDITARFGLEKIKTIGDAYLAVAGVPRPDPAHPLRACLSALGMQTACVRIAAERGRLRLPHLEFRIGLHTGPLIAGLVGQRRFGYDVWGDAVNVAAVMEAGSEPGRITVSERTFRHVERWFECTPRGGVPSKHGRELPMYFLDRLSAGHAADENGREPNAALLASLPAGAGDDAGAASA